MAQRGREFRYFPNDPRQEGDEEEDEEEEEEDADEPQEVGDEEFNEPIEIDSPDEEEDDDYPRSPDYDNDEASMHSPTGDEALDDEMDPFNRRGASDDEEDDENDAMTWESRSTISEPELQTDVDEWYPLSERKAPLPNFSLPTTTRTALLSREPLVSVPRHMGTDDEDEGPEADFVKFWNDEEMMRPNPTRRELADMVLDYFLYHGHADLIETYCEEMNLPIPEDAIKEMNTRNEIKALVLEGKMEEAIKRIEEISTDILKDDWMNYVIRKQHIIEMIREGKTIEPVEYFRAHLMIDGKRPCDERMEVLEKIFTLMVFGPEETSEFHEYYNQSEREQKIKSTMDK
uniref:CTLH domain-containing protein n=1 Tax=Caenorhabditis japonica TaxID=281687 RepID=A0A8R1E815_CAEJA